jgi:hypothetical protein
VGLVGKPVIARRSMRSGAGWRHRSRRPRAAQVTTSTASSDVVDLAQLRPDGPSRSAAEIPPPITTRSGDRVTIMLAMPIPR